MRLSMWKTGAMAMVFAATLSASAGWAAKIVVYDDGDIVDLSGRSAFVDPVTDEVIVDGDGVKYFVDNDEDVVRVVGGRVRYFAPVTRTSKVVQVKNFRSFRDTGTVVRNLRGFRAFADDTDTTVVVDSPVVYRKKTTIIEY